ncbi:MAG: hypothetical protein R2774_02220 [Saprospiraceae bacterium]
MRFELIHKDRLGNKVLTKNTPFVIHHFLKEGGVLEKIEELPLLVQYYPDEVPDIGMTQFPKIELLHYVRLLGLDEEGSMPENLTSSEQTLTKVIWGKMDKDYAALLVAGIENMDLEDIYINYKKLNLI